MSEDLAVPSQGPAAPIVARPLAHLLASVGESVELSDIREAVAGSDAPSSPTEEIDHAAALAQELGLRAGVVAATADEAALAVIAGQALLARSTDLGAWYVASPARGGRIAVATFRSTDERSAEVEQHELDRAAFCAFVDERRLVRETESGDAPATYPWVMAQPATPNAGAVTDPAAERDLAPAERLFRLLAPDRGDVLAVVAFAATIGILMLATPIAVQSIVQSVALGGTLQPLIAVATFLTLALTFAVSLSAVRFWTVELLQRRIFVRAVADLASRLPRVTRDAYDQGFGPERVNRFFDVITIQKATAKLLIDGLGIALAVVVGLGVLAFYHPILLAFDIVLVVVIAAIVLVPRRRGERYALAESTAKYEVVSWLEEIARSPLSFRAAGAEHWVVERADRTTRDWLEARRAHFRTLMTQVIGALTLQVVGSVALLTIGGWLVIQGSLTLGQLVAAELIVTAVVASVAKLGKYLETWYDLLAAVSKVGYLLDLPIETTRGELHRGDGGHGGAHLDVRDLGWTSEDFMTSLDDVSLEVRPGETVQLTGLEGRERTALVDLLWRLRSPDSGVIRLDGRDVRDLAVESLRGDVAVVSTSEVIEGSLRENVRLRRPHVSNDDVRRALDIVGLTARLEELPDGLDSVLRPHAQQLSRDDLSRLMLARAIASDPRLLVVDTSGSGAGPEFLGALRAVVSARPELSVLLLSDEVRADVDCDREIEATTPSKLPTAADA